MINKTNTNRLQNLLLVVMFIIVTLFTAFHEGYFPLITTFFWFSLIAGFSMALWLAWSVSTIRLLSLMLCIFIIEYIKETIGIRAGLWEYHGNNGYYNFGVWAWVMGGVSVYTLSTRVVIRQIRKLNLSLPKWSNPLAITLIALVIPLTLGEYRQGVGILFFSFYAVLVATCIYVSTRMEFPVFAGIVLTAWALGFPGEYGGSVLSRVWTFTYNPDYPPLFLVVGCWPVEILFIYSISAFIAKEPLDKDTL